MKGLDQYKILEWLGIAIVVAGGIGLLSMWVLEGVIAVFFIGLLALILFCAWLLVWKLIPWVYYSGRRNK